MSMAMAIVRTMSIGMMTMAMVISICVIVTMVILT